MIIKINLKLEYISYKMANIAFILGGERSGKSKYAVSLAKDSAKNVLFVATAKNLDSQMDRRIKLHKKERPCHWKTIEENKDLLSVIEAVPKKYDLIIIDCMTLFVSNLLLSGYSETRIKSMVGKLLEGIKGAHFNSIIVSNEVSLGIVPDNFLAREFRDVLGKVNQMVAAVSDRVCFMVCGLPLDMK